MRWNARRTAAGSARGEEGARSGRAVTGFGGVGARGGSVSLSRGSADATLVDTGARVGRAGFVVDAIGDTVACRGARVTGARSKDGVAGDPTEGPDTRFEGAARDIGAGAIISGARSTVAYTDAAVEAAEATVVDARSNSGLAPTPWLGSGSSGNIACPETSQHCEARMAATDVRDWTYKPRQRMESRSAAATRILERRHCLLTSGRDLQRS